MHLIFKMHVQFLFSPLRCRVIFRMTVGEVGECHITVVVLVYETSGI